MLLIGLIARKNLVIKLIVSSIAVAALFYQTINIFSSNNVDPLSLSSLYTKKYITEFIINDADNSYNVYAYSPSIYTFDYDYLFRWKGEKLGKIPQDNSNDIYLIIPATSQGVFDDFINYKTPDDKYMTENTWNIPDGTTIIKRIIVPTD